MVQCEDCANLRTLIWRSVEEKRGFKFNHYLTYTQKLKKHYYLYKVFEDDKLICSFYIDFLKETFEFSELKSGDREATQIKLINSFLIQILKFQKIEK